MQMPTARHGVGQLRAAHERGVVAAPSQRLLGRAAEQQHGVRGSEAFLRAERDLHLARAELAFEAAQRQAEAGKVGAQELQRGLELVEARFRKKLVSGIEQLDRKSVV